MSLANTDLDGKILPAIETFPAVKLERTLLAEALAAYLRRKTLKYQHYLREI